MKSDQYKKIESVFRGSASRDDLFDAFGDALKHEIYDFDLFKILLANPFITTDEVKMYAEKILKVIPFNSYHILMWTGKILESRSYDFVNLEDSINYYTRAINLRPVEFEPLMSILKLYNHDVESDVNKKILAIVEEGLNRVRIKSRIYYALADLYKRRGESVMEFKYLELAEKSAVNERDEL
jgi:hypothetical protein